MPSNNPSQNNYFPSKRDWWIVGLIWVGVVVSVVGGIVPLVVDGAPWTELVLMASLVIGLDGLMLWVLYGTGYRVTQDVLLIRCGPFSFRVHLADIESIVPGNSILSSPACSIDRLKIVYGFSQQNIMISPADKPGFLSAIVQQYPTLVVLHDRVRKRTHFPDPTVDPTIQPRVMV
jgi:hypothetical protein